MNDRELMELAAKAAGIGGGWGDVVTVVGETIDMTDIWFLDDPMKCPIWDPLKDDGDALRLAVKLELQLRLRHSENVVRVYGAPSGAVDESVHGDADAATRRSIVRAAAEIGKTMLTTETTQEQPQ